MELPTHSGVHHCVHGIKRTAHAGLCHDHRPRSRRHKFFFSAFPPNFLLRLIPWREIYGRIISMNSRGRENEPETAFSLVFSLAFSMVFSLAFSSGVLHGLFHGLFPGVFYGLFPGLFSGVVYGLFQWPFSCRHAWVPAHLRLVWPAWPAERQQMIKKSLLWKQLWSWDFFQTFAPARMTRDGDAEEKFTRKAQREYGTKIKKILFFCFWNLCRMKFQEELGQGEEKFNKKKSKRSVCPSGDAIMDRSWAASIKSRNRSRWKDAGWWVDRVRISKRKKLNFSPPPHGIHLCRDRSRTRPVAPYPRFNQIGHVGDYLQCKEKNTQTRQKVNNML